MLTYQEALAFIHGRPRLQKKPTLERMKLMLKRLGNPQLSSHYIHVAGTNGKGSVVAFLSSLLMDTGLDVGTFTSPFIVKFNERISRNQKMISDEELVNLVEIIKPIVQQLDQELTAGPTEFEVDTGIMFLYFAKHPVDIVVVEVGIGGKWDSTNVLTPDLSVITTIGYDHMKILGNTLPKIAKQKAGIIKKHHPVVVGKLPDSALKVIEQQAELMQAPISEWQKDYQVQSVPVAGWHERFNYQSPTLTIKNVQTNLMGDFQLQNAAVALTAYLEYLTLNHLPINVQTIKHGIANAQWPGRFERVNDHPLIVLDGAHNEPAFKELRQNLQNHFAQREVYVILAILSDKQYQLMIDTIADLRNVHLVLTEFYGPHNRHVANLKQLVTTLKTHYPVQYETHWQTALSNVTAQMSSDDMLIFAGSLYFISDVRRLFKL